MEEALNLPWIVEAFEEELRSGHPSIFRLSVIVGLVETHFTDKGYNGEVYASLQVSLL